MDMWGISFGFKQYVQPECAGEERTRRQLDGPERKRAAGRELGREPRRWERGELTFAATKAAVGSSLGAELAGSPTAHCLTRAWQHLLADSEKEEYVRDLQLAAVVRPLSRPAGVGRHPTPHGAEDTDMCLQMEGLSANQGLWLWLERLAHAEGRIYRGARTGNRLAGTNGI